MAGKLFRKQFAGSSILPTGSMKGTGVSSLTLYGDKGFGSVRVTSRKAGTSCGVPS